MPEDGKRTTEKNISRGKYADEQPFDKIAYLQAKLILKPDPFTSVDSFRDFGKMVKHTAKKAGVEFIPDSASELRPEIREIVFLDTPDFCLYRRFCSSASN